MSTGIQIFNQTNQLQITDSYKNLQFLRKGSITNWNDYQATFSLPMSEVVAFRTNNSDFFWVGANGRTVNNGVARYELVQGNGNVDYYVFGYANNPAGQYFEVRTPSGEVAFSDTGKYMKVMAQRQSDSSPIEVATPTLWSGNSNSLLRFDTFNFPTSKICAVVPAINIVNNYNFYANSFEYYPPICFEFRSGQICQEVDHYYSWGGGNVSLAHSYLAIDVTGL